MLKLLTQRDIKANWKRYKEYIETAFTSSEGAYIFSDGSSKQCIKEIYGRLMNPFNQTMHLWSEGEEEDYIVLTHIQICEFTGRQTLVLFSCTRTNDVDKDTITERYYKAYSVVSEFAKNNNCVGMICYSDLEYFKELAEEAKKFINVITRYQFYFPL